MIVRITFVGVVKNSAGKKKGYRDYIDVHTGSIGDAKKLWASWAECVRGYVPGDSGVFHPVGEFGEIQAGSFEEKKGD